MKSKCSFILKASTALILALLMLFGTVATSIAAVVDHAEAGAQAEDIADTGANADLASTGDNATIYYGITPYEKSSNAVKLNSNSYYDGSDHWVNNSGSSTGYYYNGYEIYSSSNHTYRYSGFTKFEFHWQGRSGSDEWSNKYTPFDSWSTDWNKLYLLKGNGDGKKMSTTYSGTTKGWNRSADYYLKNNFTATWSTGNPKMLTDSSDNTKRYYDFYGKKADFNADSNQYRFRFYAGGTDADCDIVPTSAGTDAASASNNVARSNSAYGDNYWKYDIGTPMSSSTAYYRLRTTIDLDANNGKGSVIAAATVIPDMAPTFSTTSFVKGTTYNLTSLATVTSGSNVGTVSYSSYEYYDGSWHSINSPSSWTPSATNITKLRVTATDGGIVTTAGETKNAKNARSETKETAISVTAVSYSVTYPSTTTGYTLAGTKPTTSESGQTISFTVTPDSGFRVASVKYTPAGGSATNCTAGSNNEYHFTMPAKNVTVSVEVVQTYSVTLTADTGIATKQYKLGSSGTYVDYTGALTVDSGTDVYFKVTYSSGYEYDTNSGLTVVTANTVFRTGSVSADKSVSITAKKSTYTLTKNTTSNGSFKLTNASGTEISTAQIGDTVKVVPTANTGYQVGTVKHGTTSTPTTSITASGGEYSFTMGGANEYVAVTFTAIDYKINNSTAYSSSHNAGFTAQNVKHYGDSVSITTTSLDTGWQLISSGVTVKDASNNNVSFTVTPGSNNTYTIAFTMPASNVTIALTASEKAKKTITVTNTSDGGTGTINVSGNSVSGAANSFAAGTSTFLAHVDDVLTFTATPGSQSKLSSAGIKINGTAATTLTVTDAATVTATFVNNPSTIIYVQQINSTNDYLYVWTVNSSGTDDGSVHPLGNYGGKKLSGNYTTLKINNKTYYKVEIPETDFSSKSYFAAVYNSSGSTTTKSGDLKPFAVGGTYKIDATAYTSATMAAWSDSNYAVNLTETGGTLNTTHSAAATFQSNSTTSGTTIGTNPANYAGSMITVTAHPKSGYWAYVTATYGGSTPVGIALTSADFLANFSKKIDLAAIGAGETTVTVTGSPIKTDGGTATFTMPAGATDITVNYTAIPTYTMKLSAGSHGTIALKSGSTTLKTAAAGTTENVTVTAGTSYSVVVTPDSGYLVKSLSEAGTTVAAAAGQTSAYTHSWTAPDEQPGNTYLTGTFARNDPEISTLLYNGYNSSGNSVTGYVDKAFKTSTYNGETFAYYKVSGRGSGDHLFTVTNNAEETATGSAIYFTRPNHSYWSSSGVKAHFYTDGSGTIGNEFYEMDYSYTDDYGNAVYRLNLDSYSSLKSALTADTKVTFHNSASVATATGWGLMTWAGCFYCPNAGDNNNFSLAGWPSGQKSDAFNITTGRTYDGNDNGSGKAYQHSNDGFYGSDMSLNNHNVSGVRNFEKTNSETTNDYYILYFYPNTNYGTINNKSANNTNDFPIIVASTTLPGDEDDGKITVYAKYGTVDTGHSPTAEFGSTTVVTNADVEVASTNTTDGYVVAKATPGKSITLTTTVNAANASKYYVKGWDINGTTYGLNPEATGNSYTLTYMIPEDAETLEITPIYWMKDSSKMTRFYVRSFNEAPAEWGDALYCYFYNSSTANIGYPGQPCVHEGALYYTEVPTDAQGITLNNAVWDTIHGEMMMGLSGTTEKQNAHYQTYDYDNFQKIVKEKSDGLKSIYFTFEFRDKKDNLGSTSGSSSAITLSDYNDTNGNGWEDLKDLKGNLINIFDEELGSGQGQTSLDTSKTLYVISNGYACNYEGEFATEWAVYVSTNGTTATYVTTIPSSALLINSAARLSESVYPNSNTTKYTPLLSSYTSAYNTLKNTYSHYQVKITYEKVLKYGDSVLHGNNIETNDIANRIDGKWDYTKNTDYVVADVKIQYRNTPDGAYTDDTFGGTGNYTGTTTQATAYFTNEEPVVSGATSIYQKTSCPTGTYYVSNDVYFTFLTTPKASAGYQFDGWYMKTDASDEAVLIDTSTSAKSLMDSNATFIARYTKVSSGSLTITHSSSGAGSSSRIALKAEVIDPNDNNNVIETYSGTDYVTIPTAYIKNTSSYKIKVTLYSVANPATSYIDMVTSPTAITSDKDGGSVNVFSSPTYTYDRRAASKYNQNVTTVIGAFNINALFSGTTQNTMLINYTTRFDKLPTYTINYKYHGRQSGDDYLTFARIITLSPDEAEGKIADGTDYYGNNGTALRPTYRTQQGDGLVNDITANAPDQNDLQTEVFNKVITWQSSAYNASSATDTAVTIYATETDPTYTLAYTYYDDNGTEHSAQTVTGSYNTLIRFGDTANTHVTASTKNGQKFAYWADANDKPLTNSILYSMRLIDNVTIHPVYGDPANGWNSAIDKITRTHETSDTSDNIFTDFALRFTGFDDDGAFIHINPDHLNDYKVGVAVVYDTAGDNTTETTEQINGSEFYNLSEYTDAKTMIQSVITKGVTSARLKKVSDTTYVTRFEATNSNLTNFNRIDLAVKYNYSQNYKRKYDAYAYIIDKSNQVIAVSPVKSGYLYDGTLPVGN